MVPNERLSLIYGRHISNNLKIEEVNLINLRKGNNQQAGLQERRQVLLVQNEQHLVPAAGVLVKVGVTVGVGVRVGVGDDVGVAVGTVGVTVGV
jgi:hypothetical protein